MPVTPWISNFDDLDPLREEPGVEVVLVEAGRPIPAEAALVLLPGSKTTIDDLLFIRAQGWDIDVKAHVRRGGRVLGLCGGYQMLGNRIDDPFGIEGEAGRSVEGLGLLDVATTLTTKKRLEAVTGTTEFPMVLRSPDTRCILARPRARRIPTRLRTIGEWPARRRGVARWTRRRHLRPRPFSRRPPAGALASIAGSSRRAISPMKRSSTTSSTASRIISRRISTASGS